MIGTKLWTPWITPHRFTPSSHFQSEMVHCQISPPVATPALLWSRWTAPKASTARCASASTSSDFETSVATVRTSAPSLPNSFPATSSAPGSISARTIFMPAEAHRPATALPMPLAPPVITATFPCRSFMYSVSPLPGSAASAPCPEQYALERVEEGALIAQVGQQPLSVLIDELLIQLPG